MEPNHKAEGRGGWLRDGKGCIGSIGIYFFPSEQPFLLPSHYFATATFHPRPVSSPPKVFKPHLPVSLLLPLTASIKASAATSSRGHHRNRCPPPTPFIIPHAGSGNSIPPDHPMHFPCASATPQSFSRSLPHAGVHFIQIFSRSLDPPCHSPGYLRPCYVKKMYIFEYLP
jgi:hypothetical protein